MLNGTQAVHSHFLQDRLWLYVNKSIKLYWPCWIKIGKVDHAPPERRCGAHLPLIAFEPVGG